jgi:glucarate dehydratase
MKITRIRATPINLPLEAPVWWSGGLYTGTSRSIVEVETDEGLIGLGEAPSVALTAQIEAMGERLVGLDPLDVAACESRCVPPLQIIRNTDGWSTVTAFGAIEIALWDLRGKAVGQPLFALLGGAVRTEVPFTEYFGFREAVGGVGGETTPEAVVAYCLAMREAHGSNTFEGKLIRGDAQLEISTVRRLRAALGPDAVIRLDSNMQWSVATAREVLRELEPFNIRNYEEPVGTFEELASLRQHSSIPFSSHVPDIRRASTLGVPDAFVMNFAALGGIARTVRFIGACEAMGFGFWCYSGDSGVGTAAYLHVVASQPWVQEPSQSLCRWQIADVIEAGPFLQKNDVVSVPTGPGLGVSLDRQALGHWHRDFVENGPCPHFADPALPGRYRRLPLR